MSTNLTIYNPQFQSGMYERLRQRIAAYQELTRGVINFTSQPMKGHFKNSAFDQYIEGLVSRRDEDSDASINPTVFSQDELVSVKLNRRIGPHKYTDAELRKAGLSEGARAVIFGQQAADQKVRDILNTSILSLVAALSQFPELVYDATGAASGSQTASAKNLSKGLRKFGDQSEEIVAWAMPSGASFDLLEKAIDTPVTNIADRAIYGATIGSLNRPIVVSDIPVLTDASSGGPDYYYILGLTRGAIEIEETEQGPLYSDTILGNANVKKLWQAEYAYNLGLKGMAYKEATGKNPNDTALADPDNWLQKATHHTNLPGVLIKVAVAD